MRANILRAALAFSVAGAAMATGPAAWNVAEAATSIRAVVNDEAITNYQVDQRAAFLKLRRTSGDVRQKALDELIDETLKKQEIRRRGIQISDEAVNGAYAKFAADNKLTEEQLGQVLAQAGFSAEGFRDYIRVQMGWGQAVQAKLRQSEKLSEQDVVQKMLAQGGEKPQTTEYTLQQVIFVVPEGQRSTVAARSTQANAMRSRFQSCQSTYDLAASLRDVTVRDLGRVAQPELPPRWKDDIIAAKVGGTTPVKETERGVEFIAVCNARSISDDKAAALVFQSRELEALGKQEEPDADYLKELKENAQIVRR